MTYQKLNRAVLGAMLATGVMGVASQAHALTITPSSTPVILVNTTPALDANAVESLTGFGGQLDLAYKQDFGGGEAGNAQGFYTTLIFPANDPTSATITWDGGSYIVCPTCYLVVKDGAQGNPAQYIFNISGWNGTETINVSGFWAGTQGSISHVAIFNNQAPGGGGSIAAIPEPETYAMLLAGLGLVGFAARRKLS